MNKDGLQCRNPHRGKTPKVVREASKSLGSSEFSYNSEEREMLRLKKPCPVCGNHEVKRIYNDWGDSNIVECPCGNRLNEWYRTWYSGHSIDGDKSVDLPWWKMIFIIIHGVWFLLGWGFALPMFSDPAFYAPNGDIRWAWITLFSWIVCVAWAFLPNKNQTNAKVNNSVET